ncbi:hypothetical protein DEU56DRAFT_956549 [Suillus clintonianus]|uniref:uncharacterized protein n=1 Tax=Suillus clintonianus TaxID=1904413 RepID=UPI001B862316|nr:uncharacterized protein DEU56DRAFT_956549 [Suillus clintonianus]KAG2129630.1 hypothetical protein DEU56DRAFT_956549 [Suillus clintonianus]
MASASIAPVWLYQPQWPEILQQLLRLSHEEHAFVALTNDTYDLIGYLADGYQVSPIYCAGSHRQGQTWFNRLDQVGWLVVKADTACLYPLFKVTPTGGDYISAIGSTYCRPSAQGDPLPTWLLQDLLNEKSIQFYPAPFPFGYPPPIYSPATATVQAMYDTPDFGPSTSSAVATCPSDTLQPPAPFDTVSIVSSMEPTDIDYNFWGLSTIASASGIGELTGSISDDPNEAPIEELAVGSFHPDLQWRSSAPSLWGDLNKVQRTALTQQMRRTPWWRIVMLTRVLFIGGLWVGEHLHPFSTNPVVVRRSVTNCFLTALDLVDKNYEQMLEIPVNITFASGESITAGWPVFRVNLSKSLDNTKSDLKKVVKGAMSPLTNFCVEGEIQERIAYFVRLLESGDVHQVQRAIQELIIHQVFRELLWATLFQPIKRLADEYQQGRMADLYPEEIFSRYRCLAQTPVGNLLTFVILLASLPLASEARLYRLWVKAFFIQVPRQHEIGPEEGGQGCNVAAHQLLRRGRDTGENLLLRHAFGIRQCPGSSAPEDCTLLEMNLANPSCLGCGSSVDISLINLHVFNVETSFAYYNGCDGFGADCNSANCASAFYAPEDWYAQRQCEADNVNLLIAFCTNTSEIVSGGSVSSPSSSSSTTLSTSFNTLQPPAPFDAVFTSSMEPNDIDYNFWGSTTKRFHAFVALTNDTYDLIGYLADGYQVSPIYCAGSHRQGQTWFNRLDQVGWLVVEADTACLYPLFKVTVTEANILPAKYFLLHLLPRDLSAPTAPSPGSDKNALRSNERCPIYIPKVEIVAPKRPAANVPESSGSSRQPFPTASPPPPMDSDNMSAISGTTLALALVGNRDTAAV